MQKKILVIDDDISILDSLRALFEGEGYEVETLSKTDHVLQKIFSYEPDIIVVDYMLSGTTGCDICQNLRNDGHMSDIPVIMISAYSSPVKCLKKAGINDFVAKPFAINELLEKVDIYLQ